MEFKIGDKVRLNPKVEKFVHGQADVKFDEVGEIVRIRDDSYSSNKKINIDFPSMPNWTGEEDEIVHAICNKEDIETGDIIILRNGDALIFINDEFIDIGNDYTNDIVSLDDFDNDLTCEYKIKYDIVKIRKARYVDIYNRTEKEEVKELTVEEVSKLLGYDVKIVKDSKHE